MERPKARLEERRAFDGVDLRERLEARAGGGAVANWEPVFQPAIAGEFLYVPGFAGTVFKVSRATGTLVARIRPFGETEDPTTYVAGGLAADVSGNVYYNAVRLDRTSPWTSDVLDAWLVRVAPGGTASTVSFSSLVSGAPHPLSLCQTTFAAATLPWPPSANAVPPHPLADRSGRAST